MTRLLVTLFDGALFCALLIQVTYSDDNIEAIKQKYASALANMIKEQWHATTGNRSIVPNEIPVDSNGDLQTEVSSYMKLLYSQTDTKNEGISRGFKMQSVMQYEEYAEVKVLMERQSEGDSMNVEIVFSNNNATSERNASTVHYSPEVELCIDTLGCVLSSRIQLRHWFIYRFQLVSSEDHSSNQLTLKIYSVLDTKQLNTDCNSIDGPLFVVHSRYPNLYSLLMSKPVAHSRVARSISETPGRANSTIGCALRELTINMTDIGWENWIIAPKEITVNYCSGGCVTPENSPNWTPNWTPNSTIRVASTNNAYMRSQYLQLYPVNPDGVPEPRCVPSKFLPHPVLAHYKNRTDKFNFLEIIAVQCSCY